MKNNLNKGFTLAETLIAMTIVGIIVAIVLPSFITNYQKKSNVVTLQKTYNDLEENLAILQTEDYRRKGLSNSILNRGYIGYGSSGKSVDDTAGEFLKTYFSLLRDCGTDTQPCFARAYGSINGDADTDFSCSKGYSVLLKSGVAMCIVPPRTERLNQPCAPGGLCLEVFLTKNYPEATVYVDINGPDLPNIGGRDMFTFYINEDFSLDSIQPNIIKNGDAKAERDDLFSNNCRTSTTGIGCFAKILNDNWKMNY